ncbi:sulfatase-like hydrolase/transferase [Amylibacter sp. SFDW26]|uniref:sulfatase-like hydrolase/transferase n=1 Tax=Amylibacter sp. SFDW26 TaxID=2652722 RepID=UPI0012619A0B|nr:sulfatase-like hydrolase/transferase [Amylibacter sp. SFDW26]KAB7615549.1 sulfatase-like hydrolase/transferase [Amylibacter sp. SFDW26]
MKKTLFKLFSIIVSISFYIAAFFLIVYVTPYKNKDGVLFLLSLRSYLSIESIIYIVIFLGCLMEISLPNRDDDKKIHKTIYFTWIFALFTAIPFAVIGFLFGNNEIEPILVFLHDNQIEDMVSIGADGFSGPLILWTVLTLILVIASIYLMMNKKYFDKILLSIGVLMLLLSPILKYSINSAFPNQDQLAFNIDERVHPPQILSKPDIKKNLVIIYLESVERSYAEIPEIKPFYEPISTLSDQAIDFTNIIQTTGTNFTIAGIIATQCGIPLLSNGLKTIFFKNDIEASMSQFLPKVHCLGDQLQQDGYILSYMNGASLDKFSKRSFLNGHGYTRLLDKANVADAKKSGRTNVWGLNDALLFDLAIKEFDTLASQQKPFVQSMLTISTHGPDAFLDRNCVPTIGAISQIPRAIECTGNLVGEFVNHIKNSPSGENTIVIVLSDHLSFTNTVEEKLQKIGKDRRNLFVILNQTNAKTINRHMAPFDIYPTLLETLGYKLKDGRANLGFSASSSLQNLTEELGVPTLNRIFTSNPKLAAYLWRN